MIDGGKMLIIIGLALAVIGGIVWLLGRIGFRGLPGDIAYEGRNTRVYFPIVSCIVLSLILTGIMWVWRWLSGR
jgi:hypothetical protein